MKIFKNKKKVIISVIVSILVIAFIVFLPLIHYCTNYLIHCNNPFVILGVSKFEVLGNTAEEIDQKYDFNEMLNEYDENGNLTRKYIIIPVKYFRYEYLEPCDMEGVHICVTFVDDIAVKVEGRQVLPGYDINRKWNAEFGDWFTRYPYLGFID